MPSSDYNSIAPVLKVVERIHPKSILDVGCGNGRYGFLFREIFDWNYARFKPEDWFTRIDACEIEDGYIGEVHKAVYDSVFMGDFCRIDFDEQYGLVFMGDVLEHWPDGKWQEALAKANSIGDVVLVVCPNHRGSLAQGAWQGHESEKHHVVLSPAAVGGRCLYANSKIFMCGFDNRKIGILDSRDICL